MFDYFGRLARHIPAQMGTSTVMIENSEKHDEDAKTTPRQARVLLVSYENDGFAIVEIARFLKNEGLRPFVLIGDQHSLKRRREWESRCIKHDIPYDTMRAAFHECEKKKSAPDWTWIAQFENSSLRTKTFNELMLTDPILAVAHHHRRPCYEILRKDSAYRWAECLAKHTHAVFEKADPDIVVTIERNYFVKNLAAQIALSKNLRVISFIPTRIGEFGIWVDEFGLSPKVEEWRPQSQETTVENRYYGAFMENVRQFTNNDGLGLYNARSHVEREAGITFWRIVLDYVAGEVVAARRVATRALAFVKGNLYRWSTPHSGKYAKIRLLNLLAIVRRLIAYAGLDYDDLPKTREYILFPLHVLPESSTLTLGPEYYEVDIVRRLSHRLPADMVLVVKENPSMTGLRPRREINAFKDLPNVRYISPGLKTKQIIHNARGIAGISGTALLEGALLGKPALAFGIPEFGDAISHKGANQIDAFIETCRTGAEKEKRHEAAYNYIERLASYAIPVLPLQLKKEAKGSESAIERNGTSLNTAIRSLLELMRVHDIERASEPTDSTET